MRSLILIVGLALAAPAVAQQAADPIARSEIAHLKELIIAYDKRYEQRFDAQETAVSTALVSIDKRLEGAYVTRAELWGYFIGIAGLALGILGYLHMRKR